MGFPISPSALEGFKQFSPPTLSVRTGRGKGKRKKNFFPSIWFHFWNWKYCLCIAYLVGLGEAFANVPDRSGKEKGLSERYLPCAFSLQGVQIKGKQINNKRMETKLQKFAKFDKWWPVVATS